MKSFFAFLIFATTLFGKEYSVNLYDYNGKGHWQMVGVGGFPNEENSNSSENETENIVIIDSSSNSKISGFERDESNGGEKANTVEITILDISAIKTLTLSINNENNISYFSNLENIDTLFLNIGGDNSQVKIEFVRAFEGKEFLLEIVSTNGVISKYKSTFSTNSNSEEPVSAIKIDESEAILSIVDLTETKAVDDVIFKDDETFFSSSDELKIYSYAPDIGWKYWNNRNSDEQNQISELKSGKGYWVKFTAGGTSSAKKIAKLNLDDSNYILNENSVDSLSLHYKDNLQSGWNLVSFPDSKLRDVISGFILTVESGADSSKDTNLSLKIGEFEQNITLLNIGNSNSVELSKRINILISKTPLNNNLIAIPMGGSDGNITFLSNKIIRDFKESLSGLVVDDAIDMFKKVTDLTGVSQTTDLALTPISSVYGTNILFIEPDSNSSISINNISVDINKTNSSAGTGEFMNNLPTTIIASKLDFDFDGNPFSFSIANGIEQSDKIMLASKEIIEVQELSGYRKYKLSLTDILENWKTANPKIFYFTAIIGDVTTPFSIEKDGVNTDTEDEIAELLQSKIKGAMLDSTKTYLTLFSEKPTNLRVYDDVAKNKIPLVFAPSFSSSSVLKNLYKSNEVLNSLINSDGTLSISPTNTPTRVGVSTNSKTATNALTIIDKAGFKTGKILFGENELLNNIKDKITWRKLNLNVKDEDLFNKTDDLDLFSTDKEKAYWIYLEEKDSALNEIAILEDSYDFKKNFEHYYDLNRSSTISMLINAPFSISVDATKLSSDALDRLFAYIKINGVEIPLKKNIDTFSVNLNAYDFGKFVEANLSLYIADGRGILTKFSALDYPEFEMNLTKPQTPTITISDRVESGFDRNHFVISRGDSQVTDFRIYKDPISNTDSTQSYDGKFVVVENSKVSWKEIMTSFEETITLDEGIIELFVVSKTTEKISNAILSDITTQNFVSLYCGSSELTANAGEEKKEAIIYNSKCEAQEDLVNNGVSLNSFDLTSSFFYNEIIGEELDIKTIPNKMFLGFEGKDSSMIISFTNNYIGKKAYCLFNNHLYEVEFDNQYDSNQNSYKLDDNNQVY